MLTPSAIFEKVLESDMSESETEEVDNDISDVEDSEEYEVVVNDGQVDFDDGELSTIGG